MTPPLPASLTSRVALACLLALAFGMRASRLALAPTAEEVSDVYHGSIRPILEDSEIGVNPPLLKLILNGLLECGPTITAGRVLSVLCGTATVGVVFALTRRLARGDARAAVMSAAIVALHPYAIQVGGEFRAYAPLSLALAVHLFALVRGAGAQDASDRGRWLWVAAVTAVLTSQLHYLGLAVMGALGVSALLSARWRSFVPGYLAAGASMIPWVVKAAARTELRQAGGSSIGTTVARAVSTGLRAPSWVLDPWDALMPAWLPGSGFDLFPMTVLLGGAALVAWRSTEGRAAEARPLWVVAGASVLAMAGFSVLHHVRSPAIMLYLIPFATLVSLGPLALRAPRAQWVAYAGLTALLGAGMNKLGIRPEIYGGGQVAVDVAEHWHELDAARQGGPIWIAPYGGVVSVWFAMSGHAWDATPWSSRCDPDVPCVSVDGVQFRGLKGRPQDVHTGVIVAADHLPDDFAEGCVRVPGTVLKAWTCPASP